MKRILLSAASLLALSAATLPSVASAQEYLNLYAGAWDVFDDHVDSMFGAEYRGNYIWHQLRPNLGAFVTDEGSQYYYGGFGYDFFLDSGHHFVLTPNLAVGYYEDGGGKNLGGKVEFKSGIEAAYQFENQHRLGVALHHLSNASIYSRNPGAETVTVQYSIPMNFFEY